MTKYQEDYLTTGNDHYICETNEGRCKPASWQIKPELFREVGFGRYLCDKHLQKLPSREYVSDWDSPDQPSLTTLAACALMALGGPVCCAPSCWISSGEAPEVTAQGAV